MSHNQIVKKNELIFKQNEPGNCAYLIESGRIEIFIDSSSGPISLQFLGPGEVFGEMSIVDGSLRSASAKAIDETKLIVISKEQINDRLKAADPVLRMMMHVLIDRLRAQNLFYTKESSRIFETTEFNNIHEDKKQAYNTLTLEQQIEDALNNDEFEPFLQPIHSLGDFSICGAEALIRWIKPNGDIVLPSFFVNILEESSSINRVGKTIFEKSAQYLSQLMTQKMVAPNFELSINISPHQFAQSDFVETSVEILKKYGLEPQNIKLEITERVMMNDVQSIQTLKKCQAAKFKLAIDDFGTGFSSLQYLSRMPLTDLKIDRSFITQMFHDNQSMAIIKALVSLAGELKLNIIAEGVEDLSQIEILKKLGVPSAQGYYFSHPLSFEKFKKYVHSHAT